MPSVSAPQHRAMEAAAHGHSTLGIPESVGKEFVKADGASIPCAGILLRAQGPLFLLVQNADDGQWVQPGGHVEAGESLEQAAVRECTEEVGRVPEGNRWLFRRSQSGGIDFTCYIQDVEVFEPTLDSESTSFVWCSLNDLPPNTHPEVVRSIELASGHELDIAKAIRANELSSPQHYENMWLFDLRITGTGTSFRSALDEYVYRPPEQFLTDDYVERCNGLPLIFEHPKKSILNTEEFRDRSIGIVILPYIQGDEVRGIAKVLDNDAAQLMLTSHISTSPAVVFRDAGSTETIQLEDGKTVLIEGKPSYLDHLAVCAEGVWDKGGTPNGVNIQEDSTVADNEKVPAWADGLNAKLDGLCSRMDAVEAKGEIKKDSAEDKEEKERKDAAEKDEKDRNDAADPAPVADARKDAEEKEEKERKDAAEKEESERKDAQEKKDSQLHADNKRLRADLEAVSERLSALTKPRTNEDRDELSRVQARADSLAACFGDSITPPLYDESPIAYRKRLAAKFQQYSDSAKTVRLDSMDAPSFAIIEERIYADAQVAAKSPAQMPAGRLLAHRDDSTGHIITTYTGDANAWMKDFKATGYSARINRDHKRAN